MNKLGGYHFGNGADTDKVLAAISGATIKSIELRKDQSCLKIEFDGFACPVRLADYGQDCCESRYMTCDDDLPSFVGAKLLGVEVADGPNQESKFETHEIQFLRVMTSKGTIVCETHNEHNGYYGGFSMCAQFEGSDD